MHVIRERLHVGKLLIALNVAFGVALTLPGVINIDIDVAGIFHSAAYHGIGYATNVGVVNRVPELVPTVPAHGRSPYQAVISDFVNRRRFNAGRHCSLTCRGAMGNIFHSVITAVADDVEIIIPN